LGGGGGGRSINNSNPKMTKEAMMEDLVKRSADSSAISQAAMDNSGAAAGEPVWQDAGGGLNLNLGSWPIILILSLGGGLVSFIVIASVFYYMRHKKKKKNYSFGINKKNTRYFTETTKKSKPVTNPDRGSHYLKKSPSPTGVKDPPTLTSGHNGTTINTADEYLQRKAMLTCGQQLVGAGSELYGDLSEVMDENNGLMSSDDAALRRRCSSSASTSLLDPNQVLGTLHCTMKYSFDKNALIVTVNRCENLPAKDSAAKSSDPYVKLQLLPEKQHKVKTRVMRRTLNPVYDEDFTFYGVHFNQLPTLTLHFVVLSFDRYSRDDVIGEVMLELEHVDLKESEQNPVPISKEITPRSFKLKSQGRGEILVSLCYQPAANRITVVILKARNIPKMDITGLSDPYVKIYLLYNDQRIAKKKTHVKKRTLNPVFNESFVFELPHLEEGLKNISLEFMLLDWDRVTKNEVVGRLDLGGEKCTGTALHHWNEVISSPRRQIAEWHKLRE